MSDKWAQLTNKELHPKAKELARKYVMEFATSLVLRTKASAYHRGSEMALTNDVEQALREIEEPSRTWSREFLIIVGGALFGAFVPGFVTELSANNASALAGYALVGFAGVFLIFWGLRR